MMSQRPYIKPTRKEFLRTELLACIREYKAALKYDDQEYVVIWSEQIAKRLQQIGGLRASW
jgi:hypothetical protein